MFFFEVVQIRFVLEDVDVQLAFGQSEVGADVVGKFNQFDVVAFFAIAGWIWSFTMSPKSPTVVPMTMSFFSAETAGVPEAVCVPDALSEPPWLCPPHAASARARAEIEKVLKNKLCCIFCSLIDAGWEAV